MAEPSLTTDGIRVGYNDGLGGTLAIDDAEGSEMADQLTILNSAGLNPPPLIGSGISPAVTGQTKIADLDSGAGIDISDGIQIIQNDEVFVVDLSNAETVSDALIAINHSGRHPSGAQRYRMPYPAVVDEEWLGLRRG
jgi:flagellar hook-associated protein 3 FlgL